MVSVSDVRAYLNNIASELVPDATIQKMIDLAVDEVEKESAEMTDTQTKDNAVLVLAGYKSYGAYLGKLERDIGELPPPARAQLETYRLEKEKWIQYVKRGTYQPIVPAETTETVWRE